MIKKLNDAERRDALSQLPGWAMVKNRDALHKTFVFEDFNAAFGFMTRVALEAERINHHPEWTNIYRTVNVILSTHEVEGITSLDVDLARFMDVSATQA